jgi:hypothetical protein
METLITKVMTSAIEVGFHYGNVIKLLADNYGHGCLVVREAVQNALDEQAQNIYVNVDFLAENIRVYDDGGGVGPEKIRQKFEGLGFSLKSVDPKDGMVGQKGIGNLAGLAVSREWQLVTRDKAIRNSPFIVYTFYGTELEKKEGVEVYQEELPGRSINGAPFKSTTVLRLNNVDATILKQVRDKEMLGRILREAFNHQLKTRNVNLKVRYRTKNGQTSEFLIKPVAYRGTALDPVEVETEYGPVTFYFFHSAHPVAKPVVIIQHQGANSLPISNFFKLNILPREIQDSFEKGYFEGEIRVGFCEQNADRYAFRANHELQVFVTAVTSFAEDVLQPMVQQLEDEDRGMKLRRVAESVVRQMRSFLARTSARLPVDLKAIRTKYSQDIGDNEEGSASTNTSETKGTATRSINTGAVGDGIKKPSEPGPLPRNILQKRKKESDEAKKKAKEGFSVVKPPRRPSVELTDGIAIRLVHPGPEEPFSWRSHTTKEGVIEINIVSAEFLEVEKRGRAELARFMFILLAKELTCESLPGAEAASFGDAFERSFLSLWRASL